MKTPHYVPLINPARIAWCCDQTNITLADLGKALRVSPKRLQEGKLTYKEERRMTEYFGYDGIFFMLDGVPKKSGPSVMFRTVANRQGIEMTPNLFRVINHAHYHADVYSIIMEEWGKPVSFAPPALSGSIDSKARQTREWLELHASLPYRYHHYRRAIERKEILVFRSRTYKGDFQLEHPKVTGFSIPDGEVPVIFIKKTTPEMQTFTMFHELGHLLLHGKSAHIDSEEALHGGDHAKQEREANRFAARCLLPDFTLNSKDIPKNAEDFDAAFRVFARPRGISPEVIVLLLFEEGRISQRQYDRYNALQRKQRPAEPPVQARKAPKGKRHLEPLAVFGHKYVRTLLDAAITGEVTLHKTCVYLGNLQWEDVTAMERHMLGG